MTEYFSHLAFIVMNGILAGEYDRFLLRLRAAIDQRMKTKDYLDHIVAGDE